MFIIELSYIKLLEEVDKFLISHREFLDDCYSKKYFFASGPKNPRNGGIILSNLKSRDDLDDVIKSDPFYIEKIAEYRIIEFTPIKYDKGFSYYIEGK